MNSAQPSAMATIMAFHRALEMLHPEAGRVCQDPLAVNFLPPDWAGVLEDREQLTALMGEKAKQFPGVNGAIVSRVRFIDDVVKQALSDGMRQLVTIGAGYDSRAYRMDGIGGRVTVFELDDPATQKGQTGQTRSGHRCAFGSCQIHRHGCREGFNQRTAGG